MNIKLTGVRSFIIVSHDMLWLIIIVSHDMLWLIIIVSHDMLWLIIRGNLTIILSLHLQRIMNKR